MKFLAEIITNEEGATAIEYGLLVSLISIIAILAMTKLGYNLMGTFGDVNCSISSTDASSLDACVESSDERRDTANQEAVADRANGRG